PFIAGGSSAAQILPDSQRHSAFLTGGRQLTDRARIQGSANFAYRRSAQGFNNTGFDPLQSLAHSRQGGGSFGLDYALTDKWSSSVSAGYSSTRYRNDELNPVAVTGFKTAADMDVYTADALIEGKAFHAPGGDVRSVFGYSFRRETFDSITLGQPG